MDDRTSSRQMIGTLVFLIAGPILWAIDLTIIYGAQSSLCAFGALPAPSIGLIVGGVTLAIILVTIGFLVWPRPLFAILVGAPPPQDQWPFLRGTMRALAGLSVLAMIYFASAMLSLPSCGALR